MHFNLFPIPVYNNLTQKDIYKEVTNRRVGTRPTVRTRGYSGLLTDYSLYQFCLDVVKEKEEKK